ncbi:N-acetyltransferase [Solitalea canadensis]|uniref:Acetyltransferase n=1 Tax=Solitalea canadensis (strain ATCC 29591 / DSM 3403 / JCM 21819 / LMG 8368 / NBRC 15130 / NCIMB 12057 / USAM 9D) TaxID=929556 RepID=H8KPL0_SOLCM|nr:N-acetyltransferase [Solitalea canadensis]AFD05908.1 acetyltransferase [Solitalea canadensis DSM 3403]
MSQLINLTEENICNEHICCAISDKKCAKGYELKKEWLKTQFEKGYRFQKVDVRGKVFIEYIPIEESWLPFDGQNFMVINCFWVSGQFKGQGYGKQLLEQCFKDAVAMDGVIAITGDKKRGFMSDPTFFKHMGFEIIDEAPPFFKLWGIRFNQNADYPKFKETARKGSCSNTEGITAYYSDTCPFTDYYIGQELQKYAKKTNTPIQIIKIDSKEKGHQMPIPWIISSIFYKGELITLEMKPEKHLDKLIGTSHS